VTCKDGTFKQLLLFVQNCQDAADRVYRSIVEADSGPKRLLPIPKAYDTIGSTRYVSFDTVKATYKTREDKCHVSHVVGDTETWEQKLAQTLEEMPEVHSYVKNQGLGFFIPYTVDGQQRNYMPDFIARIDDGRGKDDLSNLIVEVSGQRDREKEAKVATAKTLWVPAVNNAGTWGR
jgi:type III restriction enzyme